MQKLDEADRQLVIRALAIQGLRDPGMTFASQRVAKKLDGEKIFTELQHLLRDDHSPVPSR